MLQLERRQHIMNKLGAQGTVHIEQIASDLGVSSMTIRRDLASLEKEGKLVRSHGGAILPERMAQEIPYQTKLSSYKGEKEFIAKKAAEMIPENAKVLLDSGTTNLEIAKLIKTRGDLLIVTNDAKISMELLYSDSEVISTGGELQKDIGAFMGTHVQALLNQIRVDVVFLGANAIDLNGGISAPSMEKAFIKKLMLESATMKWVVADHSKFNRRAFAHVCHLNTINGIITDNQLEEHDRKKLEQETNLY
ncbi:DeoR/GlpR family DNA-binding transcription regulator [Halobacillus shinanisalinarum]|uniref:DeoR/GlpR family DNA-binding transcription regulator n=1 Tax=Halobacillus shinanisalinarum TaxID=2932258 RepID=A0ABY4H2R2_9BACI|nr:DeoR/GlpR family DNA-binding transcription regulator [Halobacillus shinanisalinarum]UOQ94644.1 DeoR/GlpR family DNA-binding transcription regulator [Halobacillus shinanisalinarum]